MDLNKSSGSDTLSSDNFAALDKARHQIQKSDIKQAHVYRVNLGKLPAPEDAFVDGSAIAGHEMGEMHYVVVVSCQPQLELYQIVPFTSDKPGKQLPSNVRHTSVRVEKGSWGEKCTLDGWALAHHVRTISLVRFREDTVGKIKQEVFEEIRTALMDVLQL